MRHAWHVTEDWLNIVA